MKEFVNVQSYLENRGTDREKRVFFCGYLEDGEYQEDENRYDTEEAAINALKA